MEEISVYGLFGEVSLGLPVAVLNSAIVFKDALTAKDFEGKAKLGFVGVATPFGGLAWSSMSLGKAKQDGHFAWGSDIAGIGAGLSASFTGTSKVPGGATLVPPEKWDEPVDTVIEY